jgi:hypothetical protein
MAGNKNSGPRLISVALPKAGETKIYANQSVANALEEVTEDMKVYHAVRLGQVMEAAYEQGRRDGRRQAFEKLDAVKSDPEMKYLNPGQSAATKKSRAKKA